MLLKARLYGYMSLLDDPNHWPAPAANLIKTRLEEIKLQRNHLFAFIEKDSEHAPRNVRFPEHQFLPDFFANVFENWIRLGYNY